MKIKPLMLLMALTASPLSMACSYDGLFDNPFTESYQGSFALALATQAAIKQQKLPLPGPIDNKAGLNRVTWWLKQVKPALAAQYGQNLDVLIIDKKLWSQIRTKDNALQIEIHTEPNTAQSPTILLTEASLGALAQADLTLEQAQQLGVLKALHMEPL
ncbi:hypothetical protein Q4519_05150 [Motilimonas sp. 1_MG-2023]|uniref:hypothetical protein n=1 Tax=Motilimonas sp. 1_MG-2023 TaxID=3062672 RepID=UPI0026E387C8|nr:hypothetical protein [Motilimonas sp. 1_MG-2023]MDO6525067.1 hypothetical protein [Motilimonas sp. 1_MG-2023]